MRAPSNMSTIRFAYQALRIRYVVVGCLLSLALLWTYYETVASSFRSAALAAQNKVYHLGGATVQATSNRTLGFQEIIYMSVNGRTDRSDAMLILADYTDIKVTRIPGPKGDEIDPKALPKKLKDIVGPGQLGCWRAHVDAWYRIVEIGLETALILEDDADWDVSFKDELYLLSKALAENGSPLGNHGKYPVTATEPYGVGWDMLWLGQCHSDNNKGEGIPGFKYKDATTPPYQSLQDSMRAELDLRGANEDGYRTVAKAYSPTCTTGYGVTRRGAQRLLFLSGMAGPNGPIDWDLADLTKSDQLRSLLVTPPLISQWKTGGWQDSEIDLSTEEGVSPADGYSTIGERSARKALKAWVADRDDGRRR